MAGILDNKVRVIDTIITPEGRRQLADGFMRVEYASFTDKQAFYEGSEASGSADATERIYFEASHSPIDQITLETDDTGKLLTYQGSTVSGSLELRSDGTVYQGSTKARLVQVTGSNVFASLTDKLFSNITENFKNQMTLGTHGLRMTSSFDLSSEVFTLQIDDNYPLSPEAVKTIDVENVEPMFLQARLSHNPHFKFLPPRWYSTNNVPGIGDCGVYERIQDSALDNPFQVFAELSSADCYHSFPVHWYGSDFSATTDWQSGGCGWLMKAWDGIMDLGNCDQKSDYFQPYGAEDEVVAEYYIHASDSTSVYSCDSAYFTGDILGYGASNPNSFIKFDQTSEDNNIVCQFFEINEDVKKIQKLDIVDAGYFYDPNLGIRHVFYIGKVYTDSAGYPSFINLFSLVFS